MGDGMTQREGPRIRRLATDPTVNIMVTNKAARRLEKESISLPDVQMALSTCRFVNSECRHRQWRRTIQGQDAEGESVRLVVVLEQGVGKRIVVLSGKRVKQDGQEARKVPSSA